MVRDAGSGASLGVFKDHDGSVSRIAFSPDGSRLASAGEDGVRVYDPAAARRLATLRPGGKGAVHFITFSPDGGRLATLGREGMRVAGDFWGR